MKPWPAPRPGLTPSGWCFIRQVPGISRRQQAREISLALPDQTARVGVFVNSPVSDILKRIDDCRLTAVQLHGQESPDVVRALCDRGVRVIKALFVHKPPLICEASRYPAATFLVECGKGRLPGGNALTWNWSEVKSFGACLIP